MEGNHTSKENVFATFEEQNAITIPSSLKNLLTYTGFDNTVSLSKMDENDTRELERIAREQIPDLIDKSELENYLGHFKDNPTKFCIFPGQKKILQELCSFHSKKRNAAALNGISGEKDKNKRQKLEDKNHHDVEHEKEVIHKSLTNWINNFCFSNLPQEHISHVTREISKLQVNFAPEDLRKCAITCCICLKKQKIFMNNDGFWIMSNFHKHFKTHVAEFSTKPAKKFHKNLNISNYIVKQEIPESRQDCHCNKT